MRVGHDEWRLLLRVLGSSSRIVPQSSARQAKEVAASRETSSCDTEVGRAANKSEPAAKSIATENYASDVGGGTLRLHAAIGDDSNVGRNVLIIHAKLKLHTGIGDDGNVGRNALLIRGKLKLHSGIGSDGNVGHNAFLIHGKLISVPWDAAAARGWHNAAVRIIPDVAVNCETRKSK